MEWENKFKALRVICKLRHAIGGVRFKAVYSKLCVARVFSKGLKLTSFARLALKKDRES
jgi:hypothetical protein